MICKRLISENTNSRGLLLLGGKWNPSTHPRDHINSILAALKLYLRELPDSLFPRKYYSLALRAIRETSDAPVQAYRLRVCIHGLPKPNKDTILFLSNFFHRVASHHKENGTDAAALARIFAPYILRPPPSNTAAPHPDRVHIAADQDDTALVVRRLIEEAPFLFKTSQRPLSSVESTAVPTNSTIQARALYPYAGGSKWLLPLQKDDVVDVLDIKNEDGWVKVAMNGETGYTPLSYVQIVPIQPPSDDPLQRTPYPSEFTTESVGVPKPDPSAVLSPPRLFALSPDNPAMYSSPDLSHLAHLHKLPPPPPLTPGLFPSGADSIPPPIDLSTLPSPLNLPSPLSSSTPHLPTPLSPHLISPRGLSNSVPSLPALPPSLHTPVLPSTKSNSFNNSVLPTSSNSAPASATASPVPHAADHPITAPVSFPPLFLFLSFPFFLAFIFHFLLLLWDC